MKLLFDQNISFRVVRAVENNFPGSTQVQLIKLNNAKDAEIWEYAKNNGFHVVTFDSDFYDLTMIKGFPPKIIWLRIGNATTKNIIQILDNKSETIEQFLMSDPGGCLEISN